MPSPSTNRTAIDVVEEHRSSGRRFRAEGVESFVLDEGRGDPVVCVHGVPASSYLYRKLVTQLAKRGRRGIAFDLPGLGLADRPDDFDYTWTGLGRWATAAVLALELDRFHLVVHDIGGPIGFEVAAALKDRLQSLTILNTIVQPHSFKKPWVMRPFGVRGIGEMWLATMRPGEPFRSLMRMQGIADREAVANVEIDATVLLLKGQDRGRAFLRIMRSFETTETKSRLYASVVRDVDYPVQVIWGERDPALKVGTYGALAAELARVPLQRLPGKHFLQEDCAEELAERIASL